MCAMRKISPAQLKKYSLQLAAEILQSGFTPTIMLSLWRGGAPIGLYVEEVLKAQGLKLKHRPAVVCSYNDQRRQGQVKIEPFPTSEDEKVLLIDDVYETGQSMAAVLAHLKAKETKIATIFYKPDKNETQRVPDYYLQETEEWIIFPHEKL